MPKRPHDTTIWKNQRWFRKLSPDYKLAFLYILDMCNHAGIWKIDYSELVDDCGFDDFNFDDFIKKCNKDFDKTNGQPVETERVKLLNNNSYLWITKFVQFQYEGKNLKVNPSVVVVKSALSILMAFNVLDESLKKRYITLTEPLTNPSEPLTNPSEPLTNPSETLIKHNAISIKHKDSNAGKLTTNSKTLIFSAMQAMQEKKLPEGFDVNLEAGKFAEKYAGKQITSIEKLIGAWIKNFKKEKNGKEQTGHEQQRIGGKQLRDFKSEQAEAFFGRTGS